MSDEVHNCEICGKPGAIVLVPGIGRMCDAPCKPPCVTHGPAECECSPLVRAFAKIKQRREEQRREALENPTPGELAARGLTRALWAEGKPMFQCQRCNGITSKAIEHSTEECLMTLNRRIQGMADAIGALEHKIEKASRGRKE